MHDDDYDDDDMEREETWSEELRYQTKEHLERGTIAFLPNHEVGLALKSLDGRFGYISALDLAHQKWRILPMSKTEDWQETFPTIPALIKAGWVVD